MAVQFTFPPTVQEPSLFSTPSPAFIVCILLDEGHSDWCEVISHCSFDLHFSSNEWYWASFNVFISHLFIFFGENVYSDPLKLYCCCYKFFIYSDYKSLVRYRSWKFFSSSTPRVVFFTFLMYWSTKVLKLVLLLILLVLYLRNHYVTQGHGDLFQCLLPRV